MYTSWNVGNSMQTWGKNSSLWRWQNTGTSCPMRLWSLFPWRYLKPTWKLSYMNATYYRETALVGRLDRWSWEAFPAPTVLWWKSSYRHKIHQHLLLIIFVTRPLTIALTCTLKMSWTQFTEWVTTTSLCMYLSLFSLKSPLEVTREAWRSASNVALHFIATRKITVLFFFFFAEPYCLWSHCYAQHCRMTRLSKPQ